jgi:hypothetical protein
MLSAFPLVLTTAEMVKVVTVTPDTIAMSSAVVQRDQGKREVIIPQWSLESPNTSTLVNPDVSLMLSMLNSPSLVTIVIDLSFRCSFVKNGAEAESSQSTAPEDVQVHCPWLPHVRAAT